MHIWISPASFKLFLDVLYFTASLSLGKHFKFYF